MTINNRNENALGEPVKIAISGPIISFLVPYIRQIMVFLLALLVTAGITLSIGQGFGIPGGHVFRHSCHVMLLDQY